MRAAPRHDRVTTTRTIGRFRLNYYADGTTRLFFRSPVHRGIFCGPMRPQFEYLGEHSREVAERIAGVVAPFIREPERAT